MWSLGVLLLVCLDAKLPPGEKELQAHADMWETESAPLPPSDRSDDATYLLQQLLAVSRSVQFSLISAL